MMRNLSFQHLSIGIAMLLAAVLAIMLKPTHKLADQQAAVNFEAVIPKEFGGWRVDSVSSSQVPSAPDAQASKIYDQMLSRTYINRSGQRVMFLIAYGKLQTQNFRAHRQEVCYAAQGFKISDLFHGKIQIGKQLVPVTRMFAVQNERAEPVTYWFTMGNQVVLSYFQRFFVQLKYAVSDTIPDGILVRVSNIVPNAQEGYAIQLDFLNALEKVIDPKTKIRLLGKSE